MTDTPIRTTVNNLSTFLAQNTPGNISADVFQGILTTYNNLYSTAAIPLSAVTPDYESNVAELQTLLNTVPNSLWNTTVEVATGQMFITINATAQAFNQFSIERAYQESMLDFAQLPSSIYTITRMLGVNITQKQPASCTANLTLPSNFTESIIIPAYTQTNIAGLPFFNRDQIIFPVGTTTQSVTLYQGTVQNTTFLSSGLPSQSFSLQSLDFNISAQDIVVTINNTVWSSTYTTPFFSTGLWEYTSTSQVYFQSTDSAGNTLLIFGNGNFGAIPPVNAPINVIYVTTLGSVANINNSTASFSFNVTYTLNSQSNDVQITGSVTSPNINGSDERQPSEYSIISPGTFSAKYRPSTLSDYNVFALNYPGVIDAKFQNQQSFQPNNLGYMMVLQATLLTSTTWTQTDYENFISWITIYGGANMVYITQAATPVTVNISANIYCSDQIPLNSIQTQIQSALSSLFTPVAGYIGYSIYLSDINTAIINSTQSGVIQFIQYLPPTTDNIISPFQYLVLGTVELNMFVSNRNSLG